MEARRVVAAACAVLLALMLLTVTRQLTHSIGFTFFFFCCMCGFRRFSHNTVSFVRAGLWVPCSAFYIVELIDEHDTTAFYLIAFTMFASFCAVI